MDVEPEERANRRGGRPRRSSAEVLADAAAELFLEQSYNRTTVDQIAGRAGVSRATFFNYFTAKSDVMWVELDAALAGVPDFLSASVEQDPIRAVEEALLAAANAYAPDRVPWAIAQADVMGVGAELVSSVATRVMTQHAAVSAFVAARTGEPRGALRPQIISGAVLGAAAAAFGVWVGDGVGRRPLVEYVGVALTPVVAGFAAQ